MNTAKKTWVSPKATLEEFTPNEYVSSCVVGKIQCVYPGRSSTTYDDGTNTFKDSKGMWHGFCGNNANVSFNNETASGFEVVNGKTDTSRRIYNVSNYTASKGTYYDVTWNSTDGAGEYTHKGRLIVDYIDTTHPNRS